jgi:hypothetical protein
MKKSRGKNSSHTQQATSASRSIAEKLRIVTQLRDLQEKLAPLRAANKAERAAGKIEIRIKTR